MADEKLTASNPALLTLRNVIQKYSPDIQRLIPKHVDGEKIVMIAQAALTKNPDLLKCDPRTVLAGIIQCSIMGLELHTALHHASLLPFWNSKAGIFEAMLMIEYPGLIELVTRGGEVSYVESQPVYQNDEVEIEYGTNAHIKHHPCIRGDRGRLIGAYSYAKLRDGNVKFHYMTNEDIEKRHAVSKAKDSGPWKSWEEEMYAKTPLRHLCKQLRKTTELSIGMEHENRFDQGISSVVESPNEGGLTLDFLSMNVEAKTIESKENLKKQLAERSEKGKTQGNGAPPMPPPQPGTTSTPPVPAPVQPSAYPDQALKELPKKLDEIKEKRSQKQNTAPEPDIEITDDDVPFDETSPHWTEEQQVQQAITAPMPEPTPPPAPPPPPRPRPAATTDPLDKTIEPSEATDILRAIRDKKIANDKIRAYLDGLNPRVTLLRNLTVRQKNEMILWIGQQE